MTRELNSGLSEYHNFLAKTEIFRSLLPNSRIELINTHTTPATVMKWFEERSAAFILPENYKPGNFIGIFAIHHLSGDKTYAAHQTKTYQSNGETENLVNLLDVDAAGREKGNGELRFNISTTDSYLKDKPFVGFTMTYAPYRNNGLGTRRLLMMNAMSNMLFGLPLNSSTVITNEAQRLWERLESEGKVTKYQEGTHDRYVFPKY